MPYVWFFSLIWWVKKNSLGLGAKKTLHKIFWGHKKIITALWEAKEFLSKFHNFSNTTWSKPRKKEGCSMSTDTLDTIKNFFSKRSLLLNFSILYLFSVLNLNKSEFYFLNSARLPQTQLKIKCLASQYSRFSKSLWDFFVTWIFRKPFSNSLENYLTSWGSQAEWNSKKKEALTLQKFWIKAYGVFQSKILNSFIMLIAFSGPKTQRLF